MSSTRDDSGMKCVSDIHNKLHSFFNNREINSFITTLLLFVGFYFSILTLLHQNIIDPLAEVPLLSGTDADVTVTIKSLFVLFVLLLVAVASSRIAHVIYLPPLFGCLVLGIIIRNVECFYHFFVLPPYWDLILRKLAFVNIVLRWGLATNAKFIWQNPALPLTLGLTSALTEAAAIAIGIFFILKTSVIMSILAGLVLATVSPAVSVPTMIKFRDEGYGSKKNIPDNVLATCCCDNFICVFIFMIICSVLFSEAPTFSTILLNAGTLAFGIFGGFLIGWIFWRFPRNDVPHTQLSRAILLGTYTTALIIGCYFVQYPCAGLVAGLILSSMCASRWSVDSGDKLQSVETIFKYIWDVFSLPILFVLLGKKFDCSTLTWETVLLSLGVIAIGLIARIIISFVVMGCFDLNIKEKIVITLSLLPKATIQADLGPTLVLLAAPYAQYAGDANQIMSVCILTIFFTAPLFSLLLTTAGTKLLSQDYQDTIHGEPKMKGYMIEERVDENTEKVTHKSIFNRIENNLLVERY